MNDIPANCLTCANYKFCNKASYLSLACDHYEAFIKNREEKKEKENA